jgi:hypothetical protein
MRHGVTQFFTGSPTVSTDQSAEARASGFHGLSACEALPVFSELIVC